MALSDLTTYTDLPTIQNTSVGTFKLTLYAEAGLTIPTKQTILNIGDLESVLDLDVNLRSVKTLQIDIADVYSTYTEGFWYHVALSAEMYLKIELDEGAGYTPYFFGLVDPLNSDFMEHYVSGTSFVRTGSITLVSLESKLWNVKISELKTVMLANRSLPFYGETPKPENGLAGYMHVKDVFASLLYAAGLVTEYDSGSATLVYDSANPEFKYTEGTYVYDISKLILGLTQYDTYVGDEWVEGTYNLQFNFYSATNYCVDYITHILNKFQLMMDLTIDSFMVPCINLYQRSHAFADSKNRSFGKLLESEIMVGSVLRKSGVKVNTPYRLSMWFSDKVDLLPHAEELPDYVNIDLDLDIDFTPEFVWGVDDIHTPTYYGVTGTDFMINSIDYYNYDTSTYDTADTYTSYSQLYLNWCQAVAGYLFNKFHNPFVGYTRTYGSIKSNNGTTNTHVNSVCSMRTVINDGSGDKTFYANKVIKNAQDNTLTIDWIEE